MPNLLCCGSGKMKGGKSKKVSTTSSHGNFFDALSHLGSVLYPCDLENAVQKSVKAIVLSAENVHLHTHPKLSSSDCCARSSTVTEAHFLLQSRVTIEGSASSNGGRAADGSVTANGMLSHKELCEGFFPGIEFSDHRHGYICPVISSTSNTTEAFITFVSQPLNSDENDYLDALTKQVSITMDRVGRLLKKVPENSIAEMPVLGLCAHLFDQDSISLQVKLIKYIKTRVAAESVLILLRTEDYEEIYCQIVNEKIIDPEILFSTKSGILHDCIERKETIWMSDSTSKDYISDIVKIIGSSQSIDSMVCLPVISRERDRVLLVVCLINKTVNQKFSAEDIAIVNECFHYTSNMLTSAINLELERKVKKQTQKMLQVAMNIFRKLDNLSILLREIMQEARNLTEAERCSVFLLEKETSELVAKVFDGLPTSSDKTEVNREKLRLDDGSIIEQSQEIRIPSTQGIAGYVATTGDILNIHDAYSHPLFYRGVDEETGFRTRNILCFPIKNETDEVVGVAQLCNKTNGLHFTRIDEDLARAFSVYCGISLVHSLMYKKVQDAQQRNRLANELMSYHMQVSEERVRWLTIVTIPNADSILPDFTSFECVPRILPEKESILGVLSMFDDLNLITRWRISRHTLARFILMVKRGYRDPAYHNWVHAFTVAHFIYLCIHNLPLEKELNPLELLALFVASLCHDIDHRGTNNSFQMQSQSAIAALYSSEGSVLERHHFSQTVCILNSEGCNIFENLSRNEYQRILDLIRDIILATDLAHHLRIISDLRAMVDSKYDSSKREHHTLLLCLLMTSADLSDQTKEWKNTRQVAQLIYNEFFQQGDLEKALGKNPEERFDREKACVPNQQIYFLDNIALPLYRLMADLYPECECLVDHISRNRENWRIITQMVQDGTVSASGNDIYEKPLVPDDFSDDEDKEKAKAKASQGGDSKNADASK